MSARRSWPPTSGPTSSSGCSWASVSISSGKATGRRPATPVTSLLARIADVPNGILYPVVLVLCVFGAYAIGNTLFDVMVMMVMGVVGYVMLKFAVPPAPFLIAFILGPILEDSFRQSLVLSDGGFSIFARGPICWLFLALTVASLSVIVKRGFTTARAGALDRGL